MPCLDTFVFVVHHTFKVEFINQLNWLEGSCAPIAEKKKILFDVTLFWFSVEDNWSPLKHSSVAVMFLLNHFKLVYYLSHRSLKWLVEVFIPLELFHVEIWCTTILKSSIIFLPLTSYVARFLGHIQSEWNTFTFLVVMWQNVEKFRAWILSPDTLKLIWYLCSYVTFCIIIMHLLCL